MYVQEQLWISAMQTSSRLGSSPVLGGHVTNRVLVENVSKHRA